MAARAAAERKPDPRNMPFVQKNKLCRERNGRMNSSTRKGAGDIQ